jgi:hypothetical protein
MNNKKTSLLVFLLAMFFITSYVNADALYENCVKVGVKEQMKGMEESDRYSVKIGVENGCKILVKECKSAPTGSMCKAVKKKYGS